MKSLDNKTLEKPYQNLQLREKVQEKNLQQIELHCALILIATLNYAYPYYEERKARLETMANRKKLNTQIKSNVGYL